MVDGAVREHDLEKREEMYKDLQRKVMEDGPFIIMFQEFEAGRASQQCEKHRHGTDLGRGPLSARDQAIKVSARITDRASSLGIVSAPESIIVISAVGPFEPGVRVCHSRTGSKPDVGSRKPLLGDAQDPVVVLALPRGGVPVAAEVAAALKAPLDLVLVRKIGYPRQPELAMGAVVDGADPIIVRNEDVIRMTGVSEAQFNEVCKQELAEIERRRARYLGARAPVELSGRTAIVIDDGLATGATMRAALRALRKRAPRKDRTRCPCRALRDDRGDARRRR